MRIDHEEIVVPSRSLVLNGKTLTSTKKISSEWVGVWVFGKPGLRDCLVPSHNIAPKLFLKFLKRNRPIEN